MLIALFTILFLGGSSTGMLDFIIDAEDAVKIAIEEDNRRKGALATLKESEKRTKAHNSMVSTASKDMSKILLSDAVTDDDIDAIWDAYFAQRSAYNQDMLDLRFKLKDQMTREEWEQVFAED